MSNRHLQETFGEIRRRLEVEHGRQELTRWGPAVDVLLRTILSQNTSRGNSSAGFRNLQSRFGSWDEVADATAAEIASCIEVSGLSQQKAPRIRSILRQIRKERGRIDLQFLEEQPEADAYRYLLDFHGVGPKTAWCVLLFSFGMDVFPVDTHIYRICRRMELLEPDVPVGRASNVLTPRIRPEDRYALHVLLISHGRQICKARKPRCKQCVLLDLCPEGQRRPAGDAQSSSTP